MDMGYGPYVDPELESLVDRIHPPRVCIDNDSYQDCTLVKVDSANKHGVLLAMVQVLTDLDLVISKSYICSDGRWFMNVSAAVVWTHNARAACIIQLEDDSNHGSVMDPQRVDRVQAQLMTVVNAHHIMNRERPSVRLTCLASGPTHTERRLHQLMMADEECYDEGTFSGNEKCYVTVENCREKGYSVVNVTCPDRPKLLFDTVCTLTDLQYVVFHATVCSKGSVAFQEYYIRQKDGQPLNLETQRQAITRCITAAVDRRVSHGLRLDVRSRNRSGLLSDVTRVFRENGLSIARAEIRIHGENAIGSFHVTDAAGQRDVDPALIGTVKKDLEKFRGVVLAANGPSSSNIVQEVQTRSSLGTLLWSQIERLSSKFQTLKS